MEKNWILGLVLSGAGLATLFITRTPTEHVAAFVTVAVGWALILWRLETLFRAKVREVRQAEVALVDLSSDFHVVLDQLTDTFDDQFAKVERELAQLRNLLADAVARLTHAFTFLKEQIEAQQGLLEEVAGHSGSLIRHGTILANAEAGTSRGGDRGGVGTDVQLQTLVKDVVGMSDRLAVGVAELWRVKGELEATLGEAVMALQFEDITTQLAAHVTDRLDYLKTLLGGLMKIEQEMDTRMPGVETARSIYQSRLEKMREALCAAALLVERVEHVAVHQETLNAGEVELF
ncbi:MAG: hypothetical protein PVF51_11035 [Nitrospirota bacterium]